MTSPSVDKEPRPVTEIAELWPPQGQWTEEDYFRLPETSRIVELSDGELSILPPPTFTHQRALDNVYTLLKRFVEEHELGVTAFAPLAIRLWPGKIREPDIVFFANDVRDRIGEQVSAPPTLAAEIISPGTRRTDRHDKLQEYARAGIVEYWLVDPDAMTNEIFTLRAEAYALHDRAGAGGQASSRLFPGLVLASATVFPASE